MRFKTTTALITILFFLLTSALNAQLHKLETQNLTLIYLGKPHEFIVPHIARCFENALRYHHNLFDYTPSEKVTVFLNHAMSHELVHIVATDKAAGSDHFFRSVLFGKVWASEQNPVSTIYSYLTNPRNLSPRWYHEGLAVF